MNLQVISDHDISRILNKNGVIHLLIYPSFET